MAHRHYCPIRALLPNEREGATAIDAELFGDVLPTYLTRFVGRKDECAELSAMLDEPGPVTVSGIGGAGKTGWPSRWPAGSALTRAQTGSAGCH